MSKVFLIISNYHQLLSNFSRYLRVFKMQLKQIRKDMKDISGSSKKMFIFEVKIHLLPICLCSNKLAGTSGTEEVFLVGAKYSNYFSSMTCFRNSKTLNGGGEKVFYTSFLLGICSFGSPIDKYLLL